MTKSAQIFPNKNDLHKLAQTYDDLDLASVEACLAFLQTTTEVYSAFDAHFSRFGLSRGKFTVLMQLLTRGDQGLKPSDVAEHAGVTRATITRLLDGLVREKLVDRKSHPQDRRMLLIHLTPKGRKLLDQMLPEHFCRTTALMDALSASEKQVFIKLLNKMREGTPAMANP